MVYSVCMCKGESEFQRMQDSKQGLQRLFVKHSQHTLTLAQLHDKSLLPLINICTPDSERQPNKRHNSITLHGTQS